MTDGIKRIDFLPNITILRSKNDDSTIRLSKLGKNKRKNENAMAINYEGTRPPNLEELKNITKLFNGATFDEKSVLNEFYAVEAMQSLQSESKREWILWARLAFFPQLIDGQIMKSSTLVDSTKSKNVEQSLISHTLRKAFYEDFVE